MAEPDADEGLKNPRSWLLVILTACLIAFLVWLVLLQ